MTELVAMFQCKHCSVRMYERDRAGHLERHGMQVPAKQLATHFLEGPRDTAGRPGDNHQSTYGRPRGKSSAPVDLEPEPLDAEPDVD
jgi:hypothetical protein